LKGTPCPSRQGVRMVTKKEIADLTNGIYESKRGTPTRENVSDTPEKTEEGLRHGSAKRFVETNGTNV